MNALQYIQELARTLPKMARQVNCSPLKMCFSFLRSFLLLHTDLEEFQTLCLYKYSPVGLDEFLTSRRKDRLIKKVNANVSPAEYAVFNNKHEFNETYRSFVHRDWLYLPKASEEDMRAFFRRNDRFLAKPTDGTQGKGIEFLSRDDLNEEDFIAQYSGKDILLEAFIRQHPAMAALNPTSVNTVRIISVRYKGKVLLLGAGLRCGGKGAVVDNFHNGGSAYPIDMDTGIVNAPGRSFDATKPLIYNPASNLVMPGFQVPHWDVLKDSVTRAALIPERLGYIAWDVAITPDGIDFVEGNVNRPGCTVIQLGGFGVGKKLENFLRD